MNLRKAIIVDTHPEDHSVDLVMCDDGSRLTGVPVLAHNASARTGGVDLPEVPQKADKWDITSRDGQDMEAYVGFMGAGNPVVVGFVFPQVSQMTFKDKKRRFNRHQSDVYTTVTGNGDVELYHPSGAYIRIAEDLAHEDLEKKNFDESLSLDRNKERSVGMRVSLGGVTIDIKDGRVAITASKVTVTGDVEAQGDVKAGSISLRNHTHGGVERGASSTNPPS